mmetsp:Transcript_103255/g.205238  ORF Transcript_103255/g.205238 Transcript_103255/m.205238 type:complete len:225 (-) Transcript_103255:125-799(-)
MPPLPAGNAAMVISDTDLHSSTAAASWIWGVASAALEVADLMGREAVVFAAAVLVFAAFSGKLLPAALPKGLTCARPKQAPPGCRCSIWQHLQQAKDLVSQATTGRLRSLDIADALRRFSVKQWVSISVQVVVLFGTMAGITVAISGTAFQVWPEPTNDDSNSSSKDASSGSIWSAFTGNTVESALGVVLAPATAQRTHLLAAIAIFGSGALLNCRAFFKIPVI